MTVNVVTLTGDSRVDGLTGRQIDGHVVRCSVPRGLGTGEKKKGPICSLTGDSSFLARGALRTDPRQMGISHAAPSRTGAVDVPPRS